MSAEIFKAISIAGFMIGTFAIITAINCAIVYGLLS